MPRTEGQERAAGRKRDFATIVYPSEEWVRENCPDCDYDGSDGWGSAPDDWVARLRDEHIQAFVSPLHWRDKNPDGKTKKPHWHVMVMYDAPKNFDDQVKPLFDEIGGVGRETVASRRGYARYLCHLDNPEKYQYSKDDVIQMGGAEYSEMTKLKTDDVKELQDIVKFIDEHKVYSYFDFLQYTMRNNQDWFYLAMVAHPFAIDGAIKAKAWRDGIRDAQDIPPVDIETGEIIEREE